MGIIIHQSLCGENSKKAWDLLATTMPSTSLARSIAFKTDLQDQPGGLVWIPTIRGFLQDDHFLLMKTYPDKSADVRTGRAFSHVLLIPRADISIVRDISTLFKYFPESLNKDIDINPINYMPLEKKGIDEPLKFIKRFNKAIHGYRRFEEYNNTIVWIGAEDYELAITKFWQLLTLKEKENVNFGIIFNRVAISEEKLNFVITPENIESKFINQKICVVRRSDEHFLEDINEQLLAGQNDALQRVIRFKNTIESKEFTRAEIEKVAIVLDTFENFDSTKDLKKLNSLASIVGEYSPDQGKGLKFKEDLVERISCLIKNCKATELSLVKTFNINSFKSAERKFKSAIDAWIDQYLFVKSISTGGNAVTLLVQLNESHTKNWWTKKIDQRITKFLSKITLKKAELVYSWIQTDFHTFKYIKANIDSSEDAEECFVTQFTDSYKKPELGALRKFAIKNAWYKFHSTLLVLEYPVDEALHRQLAIDTDVEFTEGIEIILENANAKAIVESAVSIGDKRLVTIAGQICHQESSLLERIDFTNNHWQNVWLQSMMNGNSISDGFTHPNKVMYRLFDNLIEGVDINIEILKKLSESDYGCLLNYSKREIIWTKFSSDLRVKFLAKTAATLLESLSEDSTVKIPNDKVLSEYILRHAIADFLYYNPLKNSLPIFQVFSNFPENYIVTYITNYQDSISAIEATQLGTLIRERNFCDVGYVVHEKSKIFDTWKIALVECYSILGNWTKMSISLSGLLKNINIPEDEWWGSLEELAVELYSNPNAMQTVWRKSGGDTADLLINVSLRSVWSKAIYELRIGKFSEISVCSLLKEMKKDYGQSEKLRSIYNLRKKFTSC